MWDFHKEKKPIAKKEHICEFCKKTIEVNDQYVYQTGVFEGDFYTRKLCQECCDMIDDYTSQPDFDDWFTWNSVAEWLRERHCVCDKCDNYNEDCAIYPQSCSKIRNEYKHRSEEKL